MGRAQRLAVLARVWLVLAGITAGPPGWPGPRAHAQGADQPGRAPGRGDAPEVDLDMTLEREIEEQPRGVVDRGPGAGVKPEEEGRLAPQEPPEHDTLAVPGVREQPAVVFIAHEDEELLGGEGLRDALLAQFALVDADLHFAPARRGTTAPDLADRIAHARELANQHDAVAVFWIVPQPDGRWVLHLMDTRGDRLVMRTVDADAEARSAAVEVVAVIARESTRALLAGDEVDSEPLPRPEPTPTARRPAAPRDDQVPPRRRVARFALGYEGTDFASGHFQSGLAVEVSVRGPANLYGGVGLTWAADLEVMAPLAFTISRLPIRAHAGYRHELLDLRLDAELGLGLDVLSRTTARDQPRVPTAVATVSPEGDSTRLAYVLAPRVRSELSITPLLGLYAVAGLEILLNNFSYISDSGREVLLLRPRRGRVLIGAGLAFYP